jgi:hypothetical protein
MSQGRITTHQWELYDTRHVVYQPAKMSAAAIEAGYWRAYHDFYRWGSILRSAWVQPGLDSRLRHLAYAGGWKKLEPLWDWVIRLKKESNFLPLLETVLAGFIKEQPVLEQPELDQPDSWQPQALPGWSGNPAELAPPGEVFKEG